MHYGITESLTNVREEVFFFNTAVSSQFLQDLPWDLISADMQDFCFIKTKLTSFSFTINGQMRTYAIFDIRRMLLNFYVYAPARFPNITSALMSGHRRQYYPNKASFIMRRCEYYTQIFLACYPGGLAMLEYSLRHYRNVNAMLIILLLTWSHLWDHN